ncbi:hypothetical protein [Providencia rettgeri]|uniref:hypothetical protein n=1 Tax=Providencia rettgeri TaxID=587 RepID=UPI0018E4AFFE|nr:hypothetical protein [Providencia rettgeri]MBI6192217.1 hypothetical protein [Providencia rettgeri]
MNNPSTDEIRALVKSMPDYQRRIEVIESQIRALICTDYQAGIVALMNVVEDIATKSKSTIN